MALTISVVTPSLNQGEFIEETILSVISQAGNFAIDYIVMDGGSTDGSLCTIKKYDTLIKDGLIPIQCNGITFRWESARDRGQADAINKGFATASGQVFGWLNSDDRLLPGALEKVARVNWTRYGFCYGNGRWISREGAYVTGYPTFRPDRYSLYCKCILCQPTVYFRKETFTRQGELSPDYRLSFDYEYWLRGVFSGERFKRIRDDLAESRMYYGNKSLTDLRASEWESWQLRERYYGKTPLCTPLLSLYRYVIEKKTGLREKLLFSRIGRNPSKTGSSLPEKKGA